MRVGEGRENHRPGWILHLPACRDSQKSAFVIIVYQATDPALIARTQILRRYFCLLLRFLFYFSFCRFFLQGPMSNLLECMMIDCVCGFISPGGGFELLLL